jgi:SAM-dependent methyltransferase
MHEQEEAPTPVGRGGTDLREPYDVVDEALPPGAPVVVDVGCGTGSLVRRLTRRGAEVIGVEVGEEPLRRAREREPVADERYEHAGAEALPLADASADVVLFVNSLHHVPGEALDTALAEAARVLRPGGLLYIQEPLAEGPYFELMRPLDDETAVRAAAHEAIGRAAAKGLRHEQAMRFDAPVVHDRFDTFVDRAVLADAARAQALSGMEDTLRERFAALAEPHEDGWFFRQPMRVDMLRRVS